MSPQPFCGCNFSYPKQSSHTHQVCCFYQAKKVIPLAVNRSQHFLHLQRFSLQFVPKNRGLGMSPLLLILHNGFWSVKFFPFTTWSNGKVELKIECPEQLISLAVGLSACDPITITLTMWMPSDELILASQVPGGRTSPMFAIGFVAQD